MSSADLIDAVLLSAGDGDDVVQVAGDDDPDAVFANLELALGKGRFVLLDGYVRDRMTFLAASELLYQRRDEISGYWADRQDGGRLLIEVLPASDAVPSDAVPPDQAASQPQVPAPSTAIRHLYDPEYFLTDCAGYDEYKRTGGHRVDDGRLATVASLAGLARPQRVLDVGCGRGELTYHFARMGADVSAVDYSATAVELTASCLAQAPDLQPHVELICGDVCTVPLAGPFDVAIASDLVEHLSPAELDALYARLSELLGTSGVFVVHTSPNRWFYDHEYPRRRARAAALGAFLPPEPRTRYERLMHINEQSPQGLLDQLSKHFRQVVVWGGDPAEPGCTLLGPEAREDLEAAPDLFAMASHAELEREGLAQMMLMTPLPPGEPSRLELAATSVPASVEAAEPFDVVVLLSNSGTRLLNSNPPNPFHLSYRWFDSDGTIVVDNGRRARLLPWLSTGQSDSYRLSVVAPDQPGEYRLRLTAVQEMVRWLDGPEDSLADEHAVSVTPSRPV